MRGEEKLHDEKNSDPYLCAIGRRLKAWPDHSAWIAFNRNNVCWLYAARTHVINPDVYFRAVFLWGGRKCLITKTKGTGILSYFTLGWHEKHLNSCVLNTNNDNNNKWLQHCSPLVFIAITMTMINNANPEISRLTGYSWGLFQMGPLTPRKLKVTAVGIMVSSFGIAYMFWTSSVIKKKKTGRSAVLQKWCRRLIWLLSTMTCSSLILHMTLFPAENKCGCFWHRYRILCHQLLCIPIGSSKRRWWNCSNYLCVRQISINR